MIENLGTLICVGGRDGYQGNAGIFSNILTDFALTYLT